MDTGKLGETRPGWTSFPVEYVENSQRKNDIYKYIYVASYDSIEKWVLVAYPGEKSPGENRTFSQKYTLGNVWLILRFKIKFYNTETEYI